MKPTLDNVDCYMYGVLDGILKISGSCLHYVGKCKLVISSCISRWKCSVIKLMKFEVSFISRHTNE